MEDVIKNIFRVNLGVKKNEMVLVFTDLASDEERLGRKERKKRRELVEVALMVASAGKEFCQVTYMELPSTMGHGIEPPVLLWKAAFGDDAVSGLEKAGVFKKILGKTATAPDVKKGEEIIKKYAAPPDAVVALSNFSTSHTRFRDYLTRCMGVRYASMPLFEKTMLTGVMTADWMEVKKRTERLVKKLSGAEAVYITSHNGTSISFSIKDRPVLADTGILTEKGSFSNLPAGEAFLAPVEGTAEGVLIIERAPTKRLRSPIEVTVKGGLAVGVEGRGEFADELKKKILEENPLIGNIAELGIGTNDKAARPDNILETEKILGTIHIALGDNSSFGGKVSVPYHEDFIFFKPTLEALKGEEKIEILIEGEPRF